MDEHKLFTIMKGQYSEACRKLQLSFQYTKLLGLLNMYKADTHKRCIACSVN